MSALSQKLEAPISLINEDYVPAPGRKQRICVLPYRSL